MGRRASIALTCAIAGVTVSLAGYWNDRFPHDRRNRQRADRQRPVAPPIKESAA